MPWNSAAYIAQHHKLGQGFYGDMNAFTPFERNIPAANCDAKRRCPLV